MFPKPFYALSVYLLLPLSPVYCFAQMVPLQAIIALEDTVVGCIDQAQVTFDNRSTGQNLSYAWTFPGGMPSGSNAFQPTVNYQNEGNYTVQLVVSNAIGSDTATATFEVVFLEPPSAGFAYIEEPAGTLEFSNNSLGALLYSWDFGDGSPLSGEVNPVHTYVEGGTYTITLSAINFCGVDLQQEVATVQSVSNKDLFVASRPSLYPNPNTGMCWLDMPTHDRIDHIYLADAQGRVLLQYSEPEPKGLQQLQFSNVPSGSYRLLVISENKIFDLPLVVQK